MIWRDGSAIPRPMKKVIYFTVFGSLLLSGLVGAIYFGIQPRSVPKIDYSEFVDPSRIGQAMSRGLRVEIQESPILLLGVWPGRIEEVQAFKALIDGLAADGVHYDVVAVDPGLPYKELFGATQEISLRDDLPRFEEGARQAIAQGKKIVLLTATPFASRLVKENQANQLLADGIQAVSFAAAPFPRSREQEKDFEIECLTAGDDSGVGSFGCAVLNKARTIYRKKKNLTKYSATLDLVGSMDYLFLLDAPAEAPKAP